MKRKEPAQVLFALTVTSHHMLPVCARDLWPHLTGSYMSNMSGILQKFQNNRGSFRRWKERKETLGPQICSGGTKKSPNILQSAKPRTFQHPFIALMPLLKWFLI